MRSVGYDHFVNLFVALSIVLAHFGKAQRTIDDVTSEAVAQTAAWLEFLMAYGKVMSAVCFAVMIGLFWRQARVKGSVWGGAAAWLLLLNIFLQIKLLFFASFSFVVSGFFVLVLQLLTINILFKINYKNKNHINISIPDILSFVGISVSLINIYAYMFYPESSINFSSRLHGFSVNPQHLSMVLALTVPSILYKISNCKNFTMKKGVFVSGFFMTLFVVFLAESRMGLLAIFCSVVAFYLLKQPSRRSYGAMGIFFFVCLVGYFLVSVGWFFQDNTEFVLDRGDTRTATWLIALGEFWASPIFGVAPEQDTGRYVFVESSFVSSVVAGGFLGLCAVLMIMGNMIRMLLRRSDPNVDRVDMSFWKSSIITVVIIGVFEAGFLGLYSAHTIIIYLILIGAHRVFDKKRKIPTNSKLRVHAPLLAGSRKAMKL